MPLFRSTMSRRQIRPGDSMRVRDTWVDRPGWAWVVAMLFFGGVLAWMANTGHAPAVYGLLLMLLRLFVVFGWIIPVITLWQRDGNAFAVSFMIWAIALVVVMLTAGVQF